MSLSSIRSVFPNSHAVAGLCALAVVCGGAVPALAQTIGETLQTTNVVAGSVGGATFVRLKSRDTIYRDEVIRTRSQSVGEFKFEDSTLFVVGPDAEVVLSDAVYGGPGSHKLLSGAMRFVTSKVSPVSDVVVTTPVASIGIRGTIVDLFVEPGSGQTSALLARGGPADVCAGGHCVAITTVCDAVQVGGGGGGGPTAPVNVSQFQGSRPASELFPFAAASYRTRSVFRQGAARCGLSSGRVWNPDILIRDPNRIEPEEHNDDDYSPPSPSVSSPGPSANTSGSNNL
ncbi:MAG: FecR domain-containing protein [Rhodobiaceae bacterium]|nr:FecR domain-containing protein [Rhodobiaceae bacterium]